MKVMISQCNPTVGDLVGNWKMMQQEILTANQADCDVVLFPELVTTAYPPQDLLYKQELWDSHDQLVGRIQSFVRNLSRRMTIIFGGLHQVQLTHGRRAKYNAAFIVDRDDIRVIHKKLLPNYQIFDEKRHFRSGLEDNEPYLPIWITIEKDGQTHREQADVLICEDIWNHNFQENRWMPSSYYDVDPVRQLFGRGPIFVLNGSPFWEKKIQTTAALLEDIAKHTGRTIVWCNQVGAHDSIVTGGYSMITRLLPNGDVVTRMGNKFATDNMVCNIDEDDLSDFSNRKLFTPWISKNLSAKLFDKDIDPIDFDAWADYMAMKLHLVDYCRRTGFKDVILGLSGGIDSALVGTIAAHALGPEHVTGFSMPSKFSSTGSVSDAKQLADNLGITDFRVIPIEEIHQSVRNSFLSGGKQQFENSLVDENIQPRCRMLLMMTESNESNKLLLSTGNLSEIAVGFCTIFGDLAAGLAVICNIPKTRVYEICRMLNKYSDKPIVPVDTIDKPPSAELSEGQKDSDSLPNYSDLDGIIADVLMDLPVSTIKSRTKIPERVDEIMRKIRNAEFKRAQMPIGPHLRERDFSRSCWRMPIACRLTFV